MNPYLGSTIHGEHRARNESSGRGDVHNDSLAIFHHPWHHNLAHRKQGDHVALHDVVVHRLLLWGLQESLGVWVTVANIVDQDASVDSGQLLLDVAEDMRVCEVGHDHLCVDLVFFS